VILDFSESAFLEPAEMENEVLGHFVDLHLFLRELQLLAPGTIDLVAL
jgi:hypothetical protein